MKTKEITPKLTSCVAGLGCPALFKTDRSTYVIVGQVPATNKLPREVLEKLIGGHIAVEIPSMFLDWH